MEKLLKKDRIEEVNPYLFQKIQARINENKINLIPSWGLNALRLSIISLVMLMGFNIYSTFTSNSKSEVRTISENSSYKQFVEENHFDALSSLYPTELLSEK